MYQSSLKIFTALSILFFTPSLFIPFLPADNFSLSGDAFLANASISLTKLKNCNSPAAPPSSIAGFGRAFYVNPVRFLDPSANATASFSCRFSFTITNTPSCPIGDGLAFLITSNITSFTFYDGYMGLPAGTSQVQDSFFAFEFYTSFNTNLEDMSDNHVGVYVNKAISLASVDTKDGLELTSWIEYRDSEKMIMVWVGYSTRIRPEIPLLDMKIDLSKQFKEFMYVGFTASNIKGSSLHTVDQWQFKTFYGSFPNTDTEVGSFDIHPPSRRTLTIFVLASIVALTILVVAVLVGSVCLLKRRRLRKGRSEGQTQCGRMLPEMLPLNRIQSATNGFNQEEIIGEGGSAVVYKGTIPNHGTVAIKRFNQSDPSSPSVPFNTEFAAMAGCMRHKNLVQLQGWCCEGNELILVYEYMPNGSLDKVLYSPELSKALTWEKRLNIVNGVASALTYLHEECERQIIHRDIKTCNILLDAEFNAKLGDFGSAEVYRHSFRGRDVLATTLPGGTMGYIAPEYALSGVATVKTDVYSFGMVVLEVATGRRPVDEEGLKVTDHVWDLWEKGLIDGAGNSRLMGWFNVVEMKTMLMVGLSCTHPDCVMRPRMREAERMLKGELPVPALPLMKPIARIQGGCEEVSDEDGDEMQSWFTPKSHFGRNK